MHTIGRTNKMRLNNIIHLTREHRFNNTLVPLHTEHYILTNEQTYYISRDFNML